MSHSRHSSRKNNFRDCPENTDTNGNSSGIINIITSTKTGINTFANDGSFLEMFKKMEEAKAKGIDGDTSKDSEDKTRKDNAIVKKRGAKVLKTGMVKKMKKEDEESPKPANDAWSKYMAEVKKYRQQACDEDGKTRPLVK